MWPLGSVAPRAHMLPGQSGRHLQVSVRHVLMVSVTACTSWLFWGLCETCYLPFRTPFQVIPKYSSLSFLFRKEGEEGKPNRNQSISPASWCCGGSKPFWRNRTPRRLPFWHVAQFSSVYHKSSCPYIQWRQKALREKYDNLAKGKCLGCISKFLKLLSVTSDRSLMPITST